MSLALKAFGLGLFAALTMTVVAPQIASAQPSFTASSYPATVTATTEQKIGSENEYFEAAGRKLECEVIHYTGTATEATSEITLTPDYTDHTQGGNCRAGGTLVVTVEENGCHEFTRVTFVLGYTVDVGITCTGVFGFLKKIIRNLLNTSNACIVTIGTQTASGSFAAQNNGNHIDISGTVGVKSTIHSNNTAICGVEAGKSKEVTTNFVINKAITLKGSSSISVSG